METAAFCLETFLSGSAYYLARWCPAWLFLPFPWQRRFFKVTFDRRDVSRMFEWYMFLKGRTLFLNLCELNAVFPDVLMATFVTDVAEFPLHVNLRAHKKLVIQEYAWEDIPEGLLIL